MFAASYPERVDRLILSTPYLRGVSGDDDRARAAASASAWGEKISGIAVVTGARISSLAAPGEVLVSSTAKDLVAGSGWGSRSAASTS